LIHPQAIVAESAEVHESAEIGAFSIVGDDVIIGANTVVGAHCTIEGPCRIGSDNRIASHAALGGDPQDKKYGGEPTLLEIGDRNCIREYCTLNRGTAQGGGVTRVGNDNWIMAYCHIAHDCVVGSDTVMANCATLAGHVEVADRAILGALTVIHQFCKVGRFAFTAMGTVVLKDIPPFVTASGNAAKPHGINAEGLKRAEFSSEDIRAIRQAYRVIYRQGLTIADALQQLEPIAARCEHVASMRTFLTQSDRGIAR
jgi:UDP-N-acetylglucosamine acyltransferase